MFTTLCTRIVLCLGLILSVSILPASAVPMLSITPPSSVVSPGQNFSLDISITDAIDLYAFQFDLMFDPTILSATSVTEGSFLVGCGAFCFNEGTIDNTAGTIAFIANTLAGPISGVNGTGPLVTIDFHALALGTSAVMVKDPILLDSAFGDIAADTVDGSVTVRQTVTGVPEPSTWLLLATGCVGLLGYSWKHRKRVA